MRREELYLADLVDNARAVRGYLDGVTRERWEAEDILRDAVLYRMLLLGEIASALPDELRDRYPDVAWRQIRAFRNLAVHKYFGVDWAVVWKIAQEEPSLLEQQVLVIISAEYPTLAQSYEPGRAPDPGTGTASLHDHGNVVDLGRNGNPSASYRADGGGRRPSLRVLARGKFTTQKWSHPCALLPRVSRPIDSPPRGQHD
jgi:uncharacterized protein with HEPN domain